MRKICLAALLVPALAWAQPRTADEWYREGENQYNLGNFEKAVDAFKQGFALETNESKKAAYLYNVAQSYRQANDCKNALFFYRRFLSLKGGDTVKPLAPKMRKDVQDRIEELEACVQQAATISKKPPNNNLPPGGELGDKDPGSGEAHPPPNKEVAGGTGHDDEDDGGSVEKPASSNAPRVVSARATLGISKISAGEGKIPVQFALAVIGGYPIALNEKLTLEVGPALTYSPVPSRKGAMPAMRTDATAHLVSLMGDVGLSYDVAPQVRLRGDVGLGVLVFAGISQTNYTDYAETSGPLSMFHVRGAVSGDYAFTRNWAATLALAGGYSPAKEGLREAGKDTKSLTSFDVTLGIGYRM